MSFENLVVPVGLLVWRCGLVGKLNRGHVRPDRCDHREPVALQTGRCWFVWGAGQSHRQTSQIQHGPLRFVDLFVLNHARADPRFRGLRV